MSLDIRARTFWAPKDGNSEEEYEDAFYPEHLHERKGHILRFAVADGASEGMLSGPWAKILVRAFCRASQRPNRSSARQIVARACDSWEIWKAAYLRKRQEVGRPVQWWEEQGLSTGPFSTLLGAAFLLREGSDSGRWDAVAMGDSCLFGVNGSKLAVRFPVESASHFSSRPVLISSDPVRNAPYLDRISQTGGTFVKDDLFFLMTDALAAWFLRRAEAGEKPWEELDGLTAAGDDTLFYELVRSLRKSGSMRNDDVTLTCIRVV